MFDAAVWCDLIKMARPSAPENAQCAKLITGLTRSETNAARNTAAARLNGAYGMSKGGVEK